MNSQIHNVPELVGPNYLQWKRKMIDVLRSRNLWRLVDGKQPKPTDADELVIWEERYDQARGLIGQTVADNLHVHIEALEDPIQVWKALATLFDKTDGVSAYYFEKKIHSIDPSEFDRIESFLAEIKTLNEKLNACGKDYKKNDTALIILV